MIDYKSINILDLAQALDLKLARIGADPLYYCPNQHKKPAPHLQLFVKSGTWKCHNCGESGNIPALVQLAEGLDFKSALSRLAELFPEHQQEGEGEKEFNPIAMPEPEPEPAEDAEKIQCRILQQVEDRKDRFRWFKKEYLQYIELTPEIVETANAVLKKRFSYQNLKSISKYVRVIKRFGDLYLAFFPNLEGNQLFHQGSNGKLIVVEGRTDFISACEIWKQDGYSILSRYSKTSRIDIEIGSETLFVLDKDDDFQNICNRIVTTSKTVFLAQPQKDLSSFLYQHGDQTRTKIEEITGQVEVLEHSHLKHKIFNTTETTENMIKFLDSFCGFDAATGRIWINYNMGGWKLLPLASARNLLSSYNIVEKNGSNTKIIPALTKWLQWEKKRIVYDIVFQKECKRKDVINTFSGFPFLPAKAVKGIEIWKEYCMEVLCNQDPKKMEFLEYFVASCFQFNKIPYYLILQGEQGTGKSFFAEAVAKMLGDYAFVATSIAALTTNFNFHLANKLFCYLEEAYFGGDIRTTDILKAKITSPKMVIELKGGATFTVPTYTNYLITTNHDNPAKAERDDRRAVIFRVAETRAKDHTYFGNLKQWLEDGGYSLLTDYYLNYKLVSYKEFDFNYTEEKKQLKLDGMDSIESFWYLVLEQGLSYNQVNQKGEKQHVELHGRRESQGVYSIYKMFCSNSGILPQKYIVFGRKSKKILQFQNVLVGPNRVSGMELDLADCIENFNNYFKQPMLELPLELDAVPGTETGTEPEEIPF